VSELPFLRMAWIHFAPEHRCKEKNVKALLELNREAASQGAQILLNTELATTGYGFQDREDVAAHVEPVPGPSTRVFADLAARYGVYLALGIAERCPRTGMFFNSAVLLDPRGHLALRYRKINTEIRWACPGGSYQRNVTPSPWGRLGLLVCSDVYHGLIPRTTALRGADLILVPANWPASGLDPRRIWRARAGENHLFVAVCNRAGEEPNLDSRNAHSGLYGPEGEVLMEKGSPTTALYLHDLPLSNGRIRPSGLRSLRNARRPVMYHSVYLDLRSVRDLTSFYTLPSPGPMDIGAVPLSGLSASFSDVLAEIHRKTAALPSSVKAMVLPAPLCAFTGDGLHSELLDRLHKLASRRNMTIFGGWEQRGRRRRARFLFRIRPGAAPAERPDTHYGRRGDACDGSCSFPERVDVATARVAAVSVEELLQPEMSVGLSKLGTDLLMGSGEYLEESKKEVLCCRTFDFVHLAAAGYGWAVVACPPTDHTQWMVTSAREDPLVARIDTGEVRVKRFQDRVDMELLLKP